MESLTSLKCLTHPNPVSFQGTLLIWTTCSLLIHTNFISGDDFLLTGANLAILETTNDIFNLSLYDATTTQTVPYWIRVMVASRMATTGEEWVDLFSQYNSGWWLRSNLDLF